MRKSIKHAVVVTAAVLGTVGVAGGAIGAWNAFGEGEVSAKATKAVDLQLTSATVEGLFPGASKPVSVSIKNPNPYAVSVDLNAYTQGYGRGLEVKGGVGCNATNADVRFSMPTGSVKVLAGQTGVVTATVTMGHAVANGCQNAEFSLDVYASGVSVAS